MNEHDLVLFRFDSTADSTLGAIFTLVTVALMPEEVRKPAFRCFTVEDEYRPSKVKGETRIPQGRYEIKLRAAGSMHPKYASKFPGLHRGMLWLQNVPGFEYVYIHIGNDDDDTEGCILVGRGVDAETKTVSKSAFMYESLYREIIEAFDAGKQVFIDVRDYA